LDFDTKKDSVKMTVKKDGYWYSIVRFYSDGRITQNGGRNKEILPAIVGVI